MNETDTNIVRNMRCPRGHALKITGNPKTGAPTDFYTYCTGGEYQIATKTLGEWGVEYTIDRLGEYKGGVSIEPQEGKIIVNSRLELYVIYRLLWDRIQMQWYGYEDPLKIVEQRLAKPTKTYQPRDRYASKHRDQEEG